MGGTRSKTSQTSRKKSRLTSSWHTPISLSYTTIITLVNKEGNKVYLLLEYAVNGNLFNFMKSKGGEGLEKHLVVSIYAQVCAAIKFLHDNNIIHRDMKPENILLDDHLIAKLCDFGWSTEAQKNESRMTFCGTYEYMAPEIFENEKYNGSVDIWSLGILLYEMIHGKSPFAGNSVFKIFKNILSEEIRFKPEADPKAADLILSILKTDSSKRPTIDSLIQHPYIQDHISKRTNMEDSDVKRNYDVVMNIIKSSTNSSGYSDDEYLERELIDFLSTEVQNGNRMIYAEDQGSSKKYTAKTKVLNSVKTGSPLRDLITSALKPSKMEPSSRLAKLKERSLLPLSKAKLKYEASPSKQKTSVSTVNSDRDVAQLYRKDRQKPNHNSDKRLELNVTVTNRDASFDRRKINQPSSLKNTLSHKIEEFVFNKEEDDAQEHSQNDSTNIYFRQANEKMETSQTFYKAGHEHSTSNSTPVPDSKLYPTKKPFKYTDVSSKVQKPNFVKPKHQPQVSTIFIDSMCKKFPVETTDNTNKDFVRDSGLFRSIDGIEGQQDSKKALNTKPSLLNKKTLERRPLGSQKQIKNPNINIVINKFYDKAKIYCNTENSSAVKLDSMGRKISSKVEEPTMNKKSSKALPDLLNSKFY